MTPADADADHLEHLPFFVYGTLRPGERNHTAHLAGRITSHTPARLPDTALYDGPGYPYAVETPTAGPVHGDLITPHPAAYASVRTALDHLEEYTPGARHNLYERVSREVHCADGTRRRAWVYVAGERLAERLRTRGVLLPGGRWPPEAEEAGAGGAGLRPAPPAPHTP
ncbi:gamma-glutamylcyclotransferase family protein [Streptomyces flavofungini]|uniref:gamma-glutamylcyclotransferase family protein n=1 Tax=Streptomyces flavofungini TaxID=68200 RepID=UPI0025AED312|nr:gamma-glutamylcyclotransferase family protein [Streptomyces flavofungini]WJV48847.1 gamma-glutamylcyclotransferase family protein [Streptomyces flavofungini]